MVPGMQQPRAKSILAWGCFLAAVWPPCGDTLIELLVVTADCLYHGPFESFVCSCHTTLTSRNQWGSANNGTSCRNISPSNLCHLRGLRIGRPVPKAGRSASPTKPPMTLSCHVLQREQPMTGSSPTDDLCEEHAEIITVVASLAKSVSTLADTGTPWASAGDDIEARAQETKDLLLLHFRREEEALFPEAISMISAGAPRVDILSEFLYGEADDDLKAHTIMRMRVNELLATLEETRLGREIGPKDVQRLRSTVELLSELLSRHVSKEHELVFPMIERLLDAQQMGRVVERLSQIRLGI